KSPVDRLLRAGQRSQLIDQVMRPGGAFALERLTQRRVGFEQVVVDERRRLVVTHVPALQPGAAAPSFLLCRVTPARRSACRRPRREKRGSWPSPGREVRRSTRGR